MKNILYWIKIIVTWPVFLIFIIKLIKRTSKKTKEKKFSEEQLYRWNKKYSSYFLWLQNYKTEAKNIEIWNEKANFIICDKLHPLVLLALIKINKFKHNAPISFLINKEKWQKLTPKLRRFYSLINHFIWETPNAKEIPATSGKTNLNKCIKNIQIPRNFVIFFNPTESDWKKIIDIPYGGFAQTLFLKINITNNKIKINFKKLVTPIQILKLNKKFFIGQIKKWNSQI